MQTLCLVLTLTLVCFAESSPTNVGTLEFDNLEVDYPDLGYEQDENWGAIFSKLLGGTTKKPLKYPKVSEDSETTSAKTSGTKQTKKTNKGVQTSLKSGDLSSFFKEIAGRDKGAYDDADEAARADATAATAAVTKGKATRTFARGNKTTGFHRVYHKDEYKKDQDFYEFDETKGTVNGAGGKITGTKASAGAGYKKGSFDHKREKDIHGKEGSLDTGFLDKQFSEFEDNEDLDGEFSNF
ncbi:hypothetical protein PYW07_009161 [Mythimna separata]|uniref:Uncharacterized protein n=1 Tax=Mythimna separata TaxID=271217 RepID=A0AAD7YBQ2_MYTSE|nr:hypothetical protein PYW07_009161 [Mythimna separata]